MLAEAALAREPQAGWRRPVQTPRCFSVHLFDGHQRWGLKSSRGAFPHRPSFATEPRLFHAPRSPGRGSLSPIQRLRSKHDDAGSISPHPNRNVQLRVKMGGLALQCVRGPLLSESDAYLDSKATPPANGQPSSYHSDAGPEQREGGGPVSSPTRLLLAAS